MDRLLNEEFFISDSVTVTPDFYRYLVEQLYLKGTVETTLMEALLIEVDELINLAGTIDITKTVISARIPILK